MFHLIFSIDQALLKGLVNSALPVHLSVTLFSQDWPIIFV